MDGTEATLRRLQQWAADLPGLEDVEAVVEAVRADMAGPPRVFLHLRDGPGGEGEGEGEGEVHRQRLFETLGCLCAGVPPGAVAASLTEGDTPFLTPAFASIRRQEDAALVARLTPPEVEESSLPCPRCHSTRTFTVPLQTRSGDEGFTQLCLCSVCRAKWKQSN